MSATTPEARGSALTNGHRRHCHCHCQSNHPGAHVCTDSADAAVRFASAVTGLVTVPMCSACAIATAARAA